MKPLLAIFFGFMVWTHAIGQQTPPAPVRMPIRIAVHHADPYMIKALLEGQKITAPEISALFGMMGMNGGSAQSAQQGMDNANALFKDGYWVVNPTDNSLWFYWKK